MNQKHGQHGIEFIKRFETSTSRFEKLGKTDVSRIFKYDTHSIEQLKKINFIKQ